MLKTILTCAIVLGSQAASGQDCVGVRGMTRQVLPSPVLFQANDTWGGMAILVLDTGEILIGAMSGQDGVDTWHGPQQNIGNGKGGVFTFGFNPMPGGGYQDTFTTHVTNAVFPVVPLRFGVGAYHGSHTVVGGTGRFRNAKGTLLLTGTWMGLSEPLPNGIFAYCNCDLSGSICNVLPPD